MHAISCSTVRLLALHVHLSVSSVLICVHNSAILQRCLHAYLSAAWWVCRVTKFNGVHSLDLHFPATFGSDQCEIHFLGLKGEYSEVGTWQIA